MLFMNMLLDFMIGICIVYLFGLCLFGGGFTIGGVIVLELIVLLVRIYVLLLGFVVW